MLLLLLLASVVPVNAFFYIPGTTAKSFEDGQIVNVTVNSLRSLATVVPYDYYRLPFCRPATTYLWGESIGQILAGDKMESSLYQFPMRVNQSCVRLPCEASNADEVKSRADEIKTFIEQGYRGHMSLDNLPGYNNGVPIFNGKCDAAPSVNWADNFMRGYAIGVPSWCQGKTFLNNHLDFVVRYHKPAGLPGNRIVGFTITPRSVNFDGGLECNEAFEYSPTYTPLDVDAIKAGSQKVQWTYSVKWIEDPKVSWAFRWDAYLSTSFADSHASVHWQYIINSILITMCLCVIAGMMLLRTLRKDCVEYNAEDPDSLAEDMGWKLVHADVFRTPNRANLLSIAVGNGVQLVLVSAATLFFALLGFLSPANRGGLLSALLITFAMFSFASGFITAKVLKMFDKKAWKTIFGSAMIFPGGLFGAFFVIDLINWHLGASDAAPAREIGVVFLLWVGSCVPLNVLGAAYGFHQDALTFPCHVGKLAREIPEQRWFLRPPAIYLLPATFPFCSIFLELRFIFDSLWLGKVYYAFTFLALVFVVWAVTVVITSMITVYYLLAYGEYRWWWRSFISSGALGAHVFAYAIYFYLTQINIITKTGTLIFFVYMGFFSVAYGLAAGTIGFISAFVFVRKIYGSIRID